MLNFLAAIGSAPSGGGGSFESIATATPNGASVSFTSIPNTYQHLQLRIMGRRTDSTTAGNNLFRINNDSGTNYAYHYLTGQGISVSASGGTGLDWVSVNDGLTGANATASVFGVEIIDIHDYASTTKNKTIRYFNGYDLNGSGRINLGSALWLSTAAINRLDFSAYTYANGSRFALYGIKGA